MTRGCRDCGEPLPSGERGRPRVKCPACSPSRKRVVAPDSTPGFFDAPDGPHAPPAPILPLPIEVRHVLGERLSNGYPSGVGGRTTYHVGGRSFETPREAIDWAMQSPA